MQTHNYLFCSNCVDRYKEGTTKLSHYNFTSVLVFDSLEPDAFNQDFLAQSTLGESLAVALPSVANADRVSNMKATTCSTTGAHPTTVSFDITFQ